MILRPMSANGKNLGCAALFTRFAIEIRSGVVRSLPFRHPKVFSLNHAEFSFEIEIFRICTIMRQNPFCIAGDRQNCSITHRFPDPKEVKSDITARFIRWPSQIAQSSDAAIANRQGKIGGRSSVPDRKGAPDSNGTAKLELK
jgi:hypothetical protein